MVARPHDRGRQAGLGPILGWAALLLDQRIASAEVLRLFPTFVWKAQLKPEIYGDLNAAILRKLDAIAPPDLAAGSGWQSGYGLHTATSFVP